MGSSTEVAIYSPLSVVVLAMRLTTVATLSNGRPRQFLLIQGEQAMFNLVPFTRARGKVTHPNHHLQFSGETLQLGLPEPGPIAIASTPTRRNQEVPGGGIALVPHPVPPAPNAFYGKLGRIAADPHIHPAFIAAQVRNPIGPHVSSLRVRKGIREHFRG